MPTCVALAGAKYPTTFNNNPIKPLEGLSLVPIIEGKIRKPHDFIGWEHYDCRAYRQGSWKIVWPKTVKKWELYDIVNDRSETNNLVEKNPQKLQEMIVGYDNWAKKSVLKFEK